MSDAMDCTDALHEIATFLDGELTDEKRDAIAEHLGDCPPCEGVAKFEAELRAVIADRCQSEAPSSLVDRIRKEIDDASEDTSDDASDDASDDDNVDE